jgi:hypothetical protein
VVTPVFQALAAVAAVAGLIIISRGRRGLGWAASDSCRHFDEVLLGRLYEWCIHMPPLYRPLTLSHPTPAFISVLGYIYLSLAS